MKEKMKEIDNQKQITLQCPACSFEFPMSADVLGNVKVTIARDLQADLVRREAQVAERLKAAKERETVIEKRSANLDGDVQRLVGVRLRDEIEKVRQAEAKKAADAHDILVKQLETDLAQKTEALRNAKEQELALRRERQKLQDAQESLALEVQRKLDDERGKLREQIKAQFDEDNRRKVAEKEKVISDLRVKLEEAQRKADQGSQQVQGEVLELDFEQRLRAAFPWDKVTEVPKGLRGADVCHEVMSKTAKSCGKILYETKRTKNWSDGWIAKLKEDMRKAGAAIGVIVTETMPLDEENFCQRDTIWVSDIKSAIPLAHVLRCILQEVAIAHGYRDGAKEKMELLYDYLTGTQFRHRVTAAVEALMSMLSDLNKERAAVTRRLSKLEKQITGVIENMAGMIGDVQGISGNALQNIPVLQLECKEQ
jgi:hypothetical protein